MSQIQDERGNMKNKTNALSMLFTFGLALMLSLKGWAQEATPTPEGQYSGGTTGSNDLLVQPTPEPTATIEPSHEDANNTVVNPDPNKAGVIEVEKSGDDSQAIVRESGRVVERITLTDDGSCLNGVGQIASVLICEGVDLELNLMNRAPQSCPPNGPQYGPCQVVNQAG